MSEFTKKEMNEMDKLISMLMMIINESGASHECVQCVIAKLLVMFFVSDTTKDEFLHIMNFCYESELKQASKEMH